MELRKIVKRTFDKKYKPVNTVLKMPPAKGKGKIHWQVIDEATGVVEQEGYQNNLLTAFGMDQLAVHSNGASGGTFDVPALGTFRRYAFVGTGALQVERKSVDTAITVSQAVNTATSSAAWFEAADVGRPLVRADGSHVFITGFTDAQNVTVDGPPIAIPAEDMIVKFTNLTTLVNAVQAESDQGGFTGEIVDSAAVVGGNTLVLTSTIVRLFSFTTSYVLTEFAFGFDAALGGSKALLELFRDVPGGTPQPVTVQNGKQLKLSHTLEWSVPFLNVPASIDIVGALAAGVHTSDTIDGTASYFAVPANYVSLFEFVWSPSQVTAFAAFLDNSVTTNPAEGIGPNVRAQATGVANDSYVLGSRRVVKRASFNTSAANGTIFSWALIQGWSPSSTLSSGIKMLIDNPTSFNKTIQYELHLAVEVSWDWDFTP